MGALLRPRPVHAAAIAAGIGGLFLYLGTMAPTVLWGDDAELQRIVVTGEARVVGQSGGASHLLWLGLARAFVRATTSLPLDAAGRTTLLSTLCGALAIVAVSLATQELAAPVLQRPWIAGVGAGVALGVSHTFWLLAVRPAVYTLQMALLAIALWGALRWRGRGEVGALALCAGAVGAALGNHLLVVASLPALAALVLAVQSRHRKQLGAVSGGAGVLVVILGTLALRSGIPVGDLLGAALRFQPALPSLLGALVAPAYLWYQFPLSLPLALVGVAALGAGQRGPLWALALLYAGNVLLALTLRVRDQFIYFLPSYVPLAMLVGIGVGVLLERGWREWAPRVVRPMVGLALAAPLLLYPLVAAAGGVVAQRISPARDLPGRDPVLFYLWPGKTGYVGAREYGEQALAIVASGAVVLGDWLPYQTLRYLQAVEGRRPDVLLAQVNAGEGRQLGFLLAQAGRPLYLADDASPPYYEMAAIQRCFEVRPEGPLFRLLPPSDPADGCAPP